MYRSIILAIVCSLLLSFNASSNPFKGTWQLVSGEYIDYQGNLIKYQQLNLSSIKVLSEEHFSFVTMEGDKFWSSGAGNYAYTEKVYVESPIYTSYNAPKGGKYRFDYQLKEDKWYNSRWEEGIRVEYEVWQKID